MGTILLWLPQSSQGGQTSFVEALFTAASAVSCTGLVVVDTATHWSHFGQSVIIILVQLGGFAFMLTSAYLLIVLGTRVNLLDFRFSDAIDASGKPACIRFALQTVGLIVLFEGLGVLVFYLRFSSQVASDEPLWSAIFHAISAFNNAGFSIMTPYARSVLYEDVFLMFTISFLVILGGISAPVLINLAGARKWMGLNLNSKIAVWFTIALLAFGFLVFLISEYANPGTMGDLSIPQKMVNAFFASVNTRTSGFAALDVSNFGFLALAMAMVLMFIGGVAGSTAGGIKVNSFAILLLTIRSYILGQSHVHAFGKQIPEARVHEAITVFSLSILVVVFPFMVLAFTEDINKLQLLFESFSAFATAGLSTGITGDLSTLGRLIIAATMFIGRLGPLTIVLAISERRRAIEVSEPEESLKVW